ncbi:class I SAM-dependent methyltransferase [Cellulosimicrobium marinum]|uniref:class I SAM-dependent methyltransferase n=1 Tax=Cellulosimicrobium marinum TaxID=1638992 RepID=UPI001E51126B|nr:class I SAM-dependent methyltransferase [Cellulosimicrobium marinum]MCB7137032.1 class I SAM-dependent methyltransferase [Cellulosimicrobium marinum]
MTVRRCRLCDAELTTTFVDLGMSPPVQSFVPADRVDEPETFYPLHVRVCDRCLLVQLPTYVPAEDIFTDYAYFSSYSDSWVRHAATFVDDAVERLGLDASSFVVEIASNDGYLLQHVVDRGIRCLGVEPAANVAQAAVDRGVPTEVEFLGAATGAALAGRHGGADLVVANNVIGHVPDLRDFVAGLRALVADDGWVSIEIPHLPRLIAGNEFDTIYHEHFQYYTLLTMQRALAVAGLEVVDVEELGTHGGSFRTWARPTEAAGPPSAAVARVLDAERAAGLHELAGYAGFAERVRQVRDDLVRFLLDRSAEGATVAAYGAAAKGNTLLNYCGVRPDLLAFCVDRNPVKQGTLLPGTRIPVLAEEALREARPDYVLVVPWNLRDEIVDQLAYVAQWGGRLVVALPRLEVLDPVPA